MEYVLIDYEQNYNGRIVKEDALYWTLPIPVCWMGDWSNLAGKIIEIRREGSLLVGVCDDFNEDPDLFELAIEIVQIKSHVENETYIIERGKIAAGVLIPPPVWPRSLRRKEESDARTSSSSGEGDLGA